MRGRNYFVCLVLSSIISAGCRSSVPTPAAPHASATQHPATAPSAYGEADDIKTTLTYIASDELEGRGLLTQGVYKAADYIAKHFAAAGLKPLPGLNGYFQDFPITLDRQIGEHTSLAIDQNALKLGDDFSPLGVSAETSFSGKAVFVGYSVTDLASKYNDYAGIDAKGKVAVTLRFEPPANPTTQPSIYRAGGYSDHATLLSKAQNAADHGAVALLIVDPSQTLSSTRSLRQSTLDSKAPIPVLQISPAIAEKLLDPAGNGDLKKIQSDIDSTHTPKSFTIDSQIAGQVEFKTDRRTYHNVIGYLPGHGPHKDEYVVIGAHYDHLGRGEIGSLAFNSHQIHNGADDNGSGTCAVLELAKTVRQAGPMDRSLIFICFCGEERGLLGSQYFVEHPPVPMDKIAYMLNLDMVGRVRDNVIYAGGEGTAKDFDVLVHHADSRSPLIIKTAGGDVGGRGGFGPSDHMSFARHQIPVLFFWSGMEPDYHRPTDKVSKINFVGIGEVVDFTRSVIATLAAMPREQYVSTFDQMHIGGRGGMRVRLGIMPDYNADPATPGVRIAAVLPDASAAKAGLREGDVIVGFDKEKVDSLGDYMTVLSKHNPGDMIDVVILRNKQRMTVKAKLGGSQG